MTLVLTIQDHPALPPTPSILLSASGVSAKSQTASLTSKDTAKGTGHDGACEEDGTSFVDLLTSVPTGEEKVETGEETGFKKTEAESERQELFIRRHEAHCASQRGDDGCDATRSGFGRSPSRSTS